VLIYFSTKYQGRIFDKLYRALARGGLSGARESRGAHKGVPEPF